MFCHLIIQTYSSFLFSTILFFYYKTSTVLIVTAADRDNTKIPIHIPALRAKFVRPRVVVVKDSVLVQQQQNERVLIVTRENTKIPIHMPAVIVKLAPPVLERNMKQQRVPQLPIVFVLKMFVLVKTVFKLLVLLVRLMVPIFVPRAPVDIPKQVIHVLKTKPLVA